ncbi:MAG: xanthine dehydrogenase small subunit, partial [Myxococcota bacterium]|nr:xanthine dehydrogenase small subunit [Myxococcota bacterium]
MPPSFTLNGTPVFLPPLAPTTTLLEWLRAAGHTGTKEGCAEGDCGACTVALLDTEAPGGPTWRSVCSCIMLLPQVVGRHIVTVEGLADADGLHPAQAAMVEALGSQCGYCTPGFVMSLFEATYRDDLDCQAKKDDQLCGNLCRCTGYRPIRDALEAVAGARPADRFRDATETDPASLPAVDHVHGDQRLVRPSAWHDLWPLLDVSDVRIVAGATDLGLDVTQRHAVLPMLVDVGALPGMRGLETLSQGGWRIGAGTRLSDLEHWAADHAPLMARMLRYFASRQIKNNATLGGNLCNASPIGDLAPVLLARDATVVLRSVSGERRVPIEAFFLSYRKTALRPGEVMAANELPDRAPHARAAAYKVSKRRELDISAVAAAFVVDTDRMGTVRHARLAFGGMAATPARARRAEEALMGQVFDAATLEDACAMLAHDFTPLDDHRGSAWYRATVAANLLRGFLRETETNAVPSLP